LHPRVVSRPASVLAKFDMPVLKNEACLTIPNWSLQNQKI
jgi:hypothetical protein